MQTYQTQPKKNRRNSLCIFLTIASAAVFSAIVAAVWQYSAFPANATSAQVSPAQSAPVQDSAPASAASSAASSSQARSLTVSSPPEGSASLDASSSSKADASSSSSSSSASGDGRPAAARVTGAYFDDAAFIGDSITTGIKLYDIMSNAEVYAAVGTSLDNIGTSQVVKTENGSITILEALRLNQPAKIYIMLGANSMAAGNEWVITKYGELVDNVKAICPGSIIYIQSVLPIYEPFFKVRYGDYITNRAIDELNVALGALAAEKGVFYLDVAGIFKDESGAMPQEYTPDGMHINSAQYTMWFDYLKENTR